MINFVATRDHTNPLRRLVSQISPAHGRVWSYERLFRQRALQSGSWVFTDHERLSNHELLLAAKIATKIQLGGARVLNHPGRVRVRYDLLRTLREAAINSFSAWRCEDAPQPMSFPVFIRNEYDHNASGLDLIPDQKSLDKILQGMVDEGIPLRGKLVIEYAGEEIGPGIWQRFASYCVAGRIIAHHHAVDFRWAAKNPEDKQRLVNNPRFKEFVEIERQFVANNLYSDVLQRAFKLANIDYGRADFSLLNGVPQIFEINTNPNHALHRNLYRETHASRVATQRQREDLLYTALRSLDEPAGNWISIDDPTLRKQQEYKRIILGTWRP